MEPLSGEHTRIWDRRPKRCGAHAPKITVMDRDLERKVERRIRLWILEQERDRKRGSERLGDQPAAPNTEK